VACRRRAPVRSMNRDFLRRAGVALWIGAAGAGAYILLFQRQLLQRELSDATSTSALTAAAIYLLIGCVRGFTLVPATSLVLLGVPFFPAARLFALTLAGIVVSSASIYRFADSLHLAAYFERRHGAALSRFKTFLHRHELPVIIGWSFFPVLPTDAVCYV